MVPSQKLGTAIPRMDMFVGIVTIVSWRIAEYTPMGIARRREKIKATTLSSKVMGQSGHHFIGDLGVFPQDLPRSPCKNIFFITGSTAHVWVHPGQGFFNALTVTS